MAQEYTFVVDGTHRTTTVTGDNVIEARQDAAFLLNAEAQQVSWLRPLPPLGNHGQSETATLSGFYSGVEE